MLSSMHLSQYADAPCGSTTMEYSARYKLLEFNMDINSTPSVALIDSGASYCFIGKSLVKSIHLTISRVRSLNWSLLIDLYIYL